MVTIHVTDPKRREYPQLSAHYGEEIEEISGRDGEVDRPPTAERARAQRDDPDRTSVTIAPSVGMRIPNVVYTANNRAVPVAYEVAEAGSIPAHAGKPYG